MAASKDPPVALDYDDLNDLDEQILNYLCDVGRASPTLFRRAEGVDQSRQYVSSRFVRLAEHGHIEDLHGTGIYEYSHAPEGVGVYREADADE